MRTLIAGVGYLNLSDLSVGPLVAEQLQRESWPAHIEVDDLSYGPIAVVHRFAETQPPYKRLVVISAADRGHAEPRVHCYRWNAVLPPPHEIQARIEEAVTGVIDFENLLVVMQQFGALPAEVYVVEVQPLAQECGMELSSAVTALMPEVRRLVRVVAQSTAVQPDYRTD